MNGNASALTFISQVEPRNRCLNNVLSVRLFFTFGLICFTLENVSCSKIWIIFSMQNHIKVGIFQRVVFF